MYNRTAIQDEAPAKFFFKGLIPPKTPDVLRHEFQKYVEKDSDSTIHSTKFVAFVIQYAAVELGVNIRGKTKDEINFAKNSSP